MKTRTKFLGWSALFLFVAVLFAPSVISFSASAQDAEPAPERCTGLAPTNR